MAVYDYRCKKCFYEFEEVQSMLDDPLTDCPKCDGKVQRIIGKNIGISFKGSGFYITDSAKSSAKPSASK